MTAADNVVVQAPFSVIGSTRRVWKLTRRFPLVTVPLALLLLTVTVPFTVTWLLTFGLLLVPWRLLRRGQRRRRQERTRHAELMGVRP